MVAVTMSQETQPQRQRHPLWRLVQVFTIALALVLLLPYLLVPLYRVVDPVSTLMLGRWATGARVARSKVPLERIASVLPATVIASEDAHFCTHHGVDWGVIRDAIEEADDLSEARGGSTITQQLAKNLFLWGGRSYLRKVLELPLALWIDLVLPMRRILERYHDFHDRGPHGQFGAQSGSRYAFGRLARDVSARE